MATGVDIPESALASNSEEVDKELEREALDGKTQEIYQDDNLGTTTAETFFKTPLLAKVGTDEIPQEVKVKNGHVKAVASTEASDKNQQNAKDRIKEKDDTEGLVEDEKELETTLNQVAGRTVHLLDPTKVLDKENQKPIQASKEEGLADNSCTNMTPFEEDLQGTSYQSGETEASSLMPTGLNAKEIEESEESDEKKIKQEDVVVNNTTNFCLSAEAEAPNNHNKEEVTESDGAANENTGSSDSEARADKHKEHSENSSPKTSMVEEETLLEDKPEEKEQDINLFTEKENDEENIQRSYDAASAKFEETDHNEHEEPDVDFKGSLRGNEEQTLEETKEKPLDDHDINEKGSLEVKNPSTSDLKKNAETTEPEIPIKTDGGSYNIHQQADASDSEMQKLQTNNDNWESTADNGVTVKRSNKTSTKQETDKENDNGQGGSMEVSSELNRKDQSCTIEDDAERTTVPVIAEEENEVDYKTSKEGNTEEERKNEDNGIKGQSTEATAEDTVSYCHEHEPETERGKEIETYGDVQDPIEHVKMDEKSIEDQVLVSTQENLVAENTKPDEMIIEKHNQQVQMIFGGAAEDMDLGAQIIEQGGETQNRYTEYAEATKKESSESKQEEPILQETQINENGKGTKEIIEQTTEESANKVELPSAIEEDVPEILKENESVAMVPKEEDKSVETDYIEQEFDATSHVEETKTRDMTIDSKRNEVSDSDCIEEGRHPKESNENLAADSLAPLVPQDETEHDASREMESANLETTEETSKEVKAEGNLQSASSDTCLKETGIEYLKPHGTGPEDINTARKLAEAPEMESIDVRNDQADIERNKDQLADALHTDSGTNEYNENLGSVETREEMESDPVSMVRDEVNETLPVTHKTNSEEEVDGHEGKREDGEVESKIEEQPRIERTEDVILTDEVNLEVEKAEESEKIKELIVKEANFPAQNQMTSLSDQESQAIDTQSTENREAPVTDENIEAVEKPAAEDLNLEPEVIDSRLVSIENHEATGTDENIEALKKQGAEDLTWEHEVSPITKAPKDEMVEGLEYPINATSSAFQLSKENKREHKVDGKDDICSYNLETVAATEMAVKKGSEEPVNSLKFEECSVPTSQLVVTAYADTDRETPATGKPNDIEVEEQECCTTESDATEQDVYQDGEAEKRSLARINGVEHYKEEKIEVSEQCIQADTGSVIVPDLTDPDQNLKEQAKEPSSKATSTTNNLEEDNTKKDEALVTHMDGKTAAITEEASTLQSIPREADNSKFYQELIEHKQNDILDEAPKPEKAGVETSEVEPQESNSVVSSDTLSDCQKNKEIEELLPSSSLDHSPEDTTESWNSKADSEDALVSIVLPEDGYEHENQRTDFILELNSGVESSEKLSMSKEKEMKDEHPKEATPEFGNNETRNAKLNEENETIDSNFPGEQATEIKEVVKESSVESLDEVRVKEEDIRTASEATGTGQIDEMLQELKAADFDNNGNNVKDQNLETRGENFCEDCGPIKMNEEVTLESQLEKTDDCVDLIKNVINTEEVEPEPREIQFDNGKEVVKEQILSEDNLNRDLQKTTETNEAANEAAQNLNGESEAASITKAMVEEKKGTEDGANDSSLLLKRSEEEIGEENLLAHIITTEDGVEQKKESDEITDVNDAEDVETTSDSASKHIDHDVQVVCETAKSLTEDRTITDAVKEEKTEVPDDIPEPIYQHTGSVTEGDKLPDERLSSENMTVHQEEAFSALLPEKKSCESTTTRAKEEALFKQRLEDPTEPGQAKETKEKVSSETVTEDKEVDVASLVTDPLHVEELSKEHDRVDANVRTKEPVVGEKIATSDSYQDSVAKTGDDQSLLNSINENNDKEASTKIEIQEKDDKNSSKIDAEAMLQSKESLESFEPPEALKLGNEFRADDDIHEQLHETNKTTADISNESVDDKDLEFMEEKLAEKNFAEGQMEMNKEVETLSEMNKEMQEEHQTKNMVLSEENLQLHESTAESIGEDQSNEPEAGIDNKSGDVKDCNLEYPDQKFSAEDSRDGRGKMTDKITSENQTNKTGGHTETNGNSMITQEVPAKTQMDEVGEIKEQSVEDLIETNDDDIITREIEQVPAETQKDEVGEIKEQSMEEDSSNRELDTSSSKDRIETNEDYIITRGFEQVSAETQKDEVGDIKEQSVEGDSSNRGLDTSSSKDSIETDDDDIITQEIEQVPAETQKDVVGEMKEQRVEKDSSNRKLETSSSKDRIETNDDEIITREIEQVPAETHKDYVDEIKEQCVEEYSSNRGLDTSSSKDHIETNKNYIITREIEQFPAETQKDEVGKIKEQSMEEDSGTRGWDTLSSNEIANTIIYPDPTSTENRKTTDKSSNKIEGDEISEKTISSSKLTEHPEESSLEIPPEEAKFDDNATTEKIENKSTKQNDTSCTENSEYTLTTSTKEGTCTNEGYPKDVEVSQLEPETISNIKGDGPDEPPELETKETTEAAALDISEAELAKHDNDQLGVKDNNALITHEGELSAHLEIPQVNDTEAEELTREDVGEVSEVAPIHNTLETYEAKKERVEGDTSNCTRLVDGRKTMSTLPDSTSLRSEITEGLNLSDQEVSVINPDVTSPTTKSLEELEDKEIEDPKDEKQQNLISDKQSMDELIIPLEEKSIANENGKEPGHRPSNGERKMVDETEIQGTNIAAKEGLEIPLPGETADQTEVSEITRDTQSLGKDIIYMKQILSQPDTDQSTKATFSTGSMDVPVELEVPSSKTFDFEVEDLRSGNASGAEQGRNTVEFGEGKTGGDENKEVIEQLATVESDSSSLAIKSQGSTKERSGVAENSVKDKEPADKMDNQQPENVGTRDFAGAKTDEENEEEDEKNDSQEIDPSSDAPVIVEESREVNNKVHKKSHNLLSGVGSKMKHSIAKVKKAITGKSSHAKPSSPK